MQNKINDWTNQLNELTQTFQSEFGDLSAEELNWKPNATTWSVAQVIDHIMTVNKTYFPVLEQLRAGSYTVPWTGRISFLTRFFGNLILSSVNPDQKRKTKTMSIWEPENSQIRTDILQQFTDHQKKLITLIQSSKDLLEKQTVISSPANRNIVYSLERAFDIIVAHEKRHLNQARETWALQEKTSVN